MNRAALFLVASLAVAACGSNDAPMRVPTTPMPSASDAKGGAVDPLQTPTPHSTPQPYPSGTPMPGDAAHATTLVERYERALVDGDWGTAYGMLAPAQRLLVNPGEFSAERSAFMRGVGGRVALEPALHDRQTIESWTADATSTRGADLASAFVITVDYPAIAASTNANFDVFLVAPDRGGAWWIWPLR